MGIKTKIHKNQNKMMKTTLGTSVAALIAFAGMESTGVNAIAVR